MISRFCRCLLLAACAWAFPGCSAGVGPRVQVEAQAPALPATFALCAASERRLFIWDMHPIPAPTLARSVCDSLQSLGYRMEFRDRADFLVHVQAFAGDRRPGAKLAVLECLDPRSRERVWVGEAAAAGPSGAFDLQGLCAGLSRDRGFARFLAGSHAVPGETAP